MKTHIAKRAFAVLLPALLLLAGCATTRYEFTPPPTDQGRYCVTQCASIKETCNGNEIHRAESEKSSCERSSTIAYVACMGKGGGKEQDKECDKQRRYCYSSPDTDRCDTDYRSCYMNCGGIVRAYEEK